MPVVREFRKLKVWEKSHQLVLAIYKATAQFPNHELYGLTSQMRRAAVSIPSNIAEGCGKSSEAELARYMQISMGSTSELEYQLLLARDLAYLNPEQYENMNLRLLEIKMMLGPFIKRLHGD